MAPPPATFPFPIEFGYSCLGPVHIPIPSPTSCNHQNLDVILQPAAVNITGTGITVSPSTIPRCSTTTVTSRY